MKFLPPLLLSIAICAYGCNSKIDGNTYQRAKAIIPEEVPANPDLLLRCKAIGDLNNDGIADSVVVLQDTASDLAEHVLSVYLSSSKDLALFLSTDSAISPQYENGREGGSTGPWFDTLFISKGILTISESLIRGNFSNKFRFQDGGLRLIGHVYVESDGHGSMTNVDYNLSTGKFHYMDEDYTQDTLRQKIDSSYKMNNLPDLRSFVPFRISVANGLFQL